MKRKLQIKDQQPVAPEFEVSFPDVVFDKKISVFDEKGWKLKGKWKPYEVRPGRQGQMQKQSMFSEKTGDELVIKFTGTGISLTGNWYRDGGMADVYVDGNLHRSNRYLL